MMDRRTWQWVRAAVLLLVIIVGAIASQQGERQARDSAPDPQASTPVETTSSANDDRAIVREQTIRDESGEVAHEGDIDLTKTLERIDRGERLRFRNDGTVFQNRERRLPRQPSGYYREWVHPTPSLSGPGPQRIVTGQEGEAWYTPDHYETFQRVR